MSKAIKKKKKKSMFNFIVQLRHLGTVYYETVAKVR